MDFLPIYTILLGRKTIHFLIHNCTRSLRGGQWDDGTTSARDIECAHGAGCGRAILVKTGNSRQAQQTLAEKDLHPDYVALDLYDAARWLIGFQS